VTAVATEVFAAKVLGADGSDEEARDAGFDRADTNARDTEREIDDAGASRGKAEFVPGPVTQPTRPPSGSDSWSDLCSLKPKHRFCLYVAPGIPTPVSFDALAAADRAWDAVTNVLGVPEPVGMLDDPWPVYLTRDATRGSDAFFEARDPRSRFDEGASFAMVDPTLSPGCSLDFAFARAIARGSLWRTIPAADPGSASAESETLARLATPCAAPDSGDVREFQAHPERCVVDARDPSFARGAALFFDWLDGHFGARPAAITLGMEALSPTTTRPAPWADGRWASSPTGFDVLRVSLANALWKGSSLEEVFAAFAVDRAALQPAPASAWTIAWPKPARRLASPEPIAPTGSSYILIDRAGAAPAARLRLEAQWEDYTRMRWTVLKRDSRRRVLSSISVRSLDRQTRASMTIDGLDGVDQVVVVAVNVGSTDHGFDPDQGEWEPHGWLLTVEGE
jgi:hypothetical protein